VLWGVFESNLVNTLRTLCGDAWIEKNQGVKVRIEELGCEHPQLSAEAQAVLREASLAGIDLMDYRHAIMHGSLIPFPSMPSFIRKPPSRSAQPHVAYVDANLLDMALDSAWTLCRVIVALTTACQDPTKMASLSAMRPEVYRARLSAKGIELHGRNAGGGND
jgi:hypothetical protein